MGLWLFRKNVDRQMWLTEFHELYRQGVPAVGFVAGFFSEKTLSNSDLMGLEESRQTLNRLLRRVKTMARPRDDNLFKLKVDYEFLLWGCMGFCEWRIKHSEAPSRRRLGKMTFFMTIAVEHWKSLRLSLGDGTDQGLGRS